MADDKQVESNDTQANESGAATGSTTRFGRWFSQFLPSQHRQATSLLFVITPVVLILFAALYAAGFIGIAQSNDVGSVAEHTASTVGNASAVAIAALLGVFFVLMIYVFTRRLDERDFEGLRGALLRMVQLTYLFGFFFLFIVLLPFIMMIPGLFENTGAQATPTRA